jgi:hypothetical protein
MLTKESAVKRILRFLAQVAVSTMFSLLGGMLLLFVAWTGVVETANDPGAKVLIVCISLGGLGFILGTTVGAATGETIFQRVSRRRGSFWRALLGSAAGLLAGGCVVGAMWVLEVSMTGWFWATAIAGISAPMAVGAVLGSWGKAKPAKATSPSS